MPTYKVDMRYKRTVTFYVYAADDDAVHDFLQDHPDWEPSDVFGLIESDKQDEDEYGINPSKIVANWMIDDTGELREAEGCWMINDVGDLVERP